ncbi:ATP-dependent DNA helicase chl1 [Clarireedia jacksonii]
MTAPHQQQQRPGKVKKDFHHPYTPYEIQETFMQTVYDVLEEGKIGILESPTGTGKSLSLICGAMTWLREWKGREWVGLWEEGGAGGKGRGREEGGNGARMEIGFDEEEEEEEEDEPDWIRDAARERMKKEMLRKREDLEGRLRRVREKERREMDKMNGIGRGSKRRKMGGDDGQNGVEKDEENFVLDDWDSDAEAGGNAKTGDEAVFSKETLELMEAVGMRARKIEEEEDDVDEMKIFYCSRTHSQLTQFINELRRVNFPPSIPPSDLAQSPSTDLSEPIKHLTLGSRKNLCINPKVNTLSSVTVINERCAELQQSSTPGEQKCPHLPTKDNKPLVHTFRDHALATIRDIEDMGSLGKELSICPYYASRAAIKPAEIVTLPYPLLLQKSAREALGISLKGHVVIIDEAHNLMDAISGIYGSEISLRELRLGREMLGAYLKKFAKRLMGKNRVYVAQVVRVVDSLVGYLEGKLEGKVGLLFVSFLLSLELTSFCGRMRFGLEDGLI